MRPAKLVRAAAILAMLFGSAAARADDCEMLRALTHRDDGKVEGLGLTLDRNGRIDVTYYGDPTFLKHAAECDISGPADSFDLDCGWQETELADAEQRLSRMREKIEACLPVAFQPDSSPYQAANYKVRQLWRAEIIYESDAFEGERLIDLSLIDHDRVPAEYRVRLNIWR